MSSDRPSHPPTLLRLAERVLKDEQLIPSGSRVLVAVSGGPDSMALLHALGCMRRKMDFGLHACGVDHGLRVEGPQELALAQELAKKLDVSFCVERLDLDKGPNLMARARVARFEALRRVARGLGAASIAVGHHADDRAETVLMRLLRGAGPTGLAVLPARSDDLIRPLIQARRSDILAHLKRHDVPFATDPSNQDRHYLRARIRHDVLPGLEALSPNLVTNLCNLAEDLRALGLEPSYPPLNRSQLRMLGQAAAARRQATRVALPAGRVARVELSTGTIVIEHGETRDPGRRRGLRKKNE